jgi:hypothetical protein
VGVGDLPPAKPGKPGEAPKDRKSAVKVPRHAPPCTQRLPRRPRSKWDWLGRPQSPNVDRKNADRAAGQGSVKPSATPEQVRGNPAPQGLEHTACKTSC